MSTGLRNAIFASVLASCLAVAPAASQAASALKRLSISGEQLFDDNNQPIRLRGANLEGVTDVEADELANVLKFNFVRLRISYEPQNLVADGSDFTDAYKKSIQNWVGILKSRHIWVDLEMRANDELTNSAALYDTSSVAFQKYLSAWMSLAGIYKDKDYIAAYGLLAEPSVNHTKTADRVGTLVNFQRTLMDHISEIDNRTPFIVGTDWNYDTMQYRYDQYYSDPALEPYRQRLIYAVNFLSPKEWIQDGTWTVDDRHPVYPCSVDGLPPFPGLPDSDDMEQIFNVERQKDGYYQRTLTPAFIKWYLQWPMAFKSAHHVPMLVDQFGASTESNGQLAYEADLIRYFESSGFNWSRWAYNAGSKTRRIEGNPNVVHFYVQVMSRVSP